MRIFSRITLKDFWVKPKYHDAEEPLKAWFAETENARWKNTAQVKASFRTVDFVNGLAIFNIHGNKYRLIVDINFDYQSVYVHFVGTHKQYGNFKF